MNAPQPFPTSNLPLQPAKRGMPLHSRKPKPLLPLTWLLPMLMALRLHKPWKLRTQP